MARPALPPPPTGADALAALNVALILVPQSLAYATIAGLDPVYGLYAAVAAPIAGALVGSSPYLQTGPVAVTSLLTFGALAPLAEPTSARFAALAAALAVLVGLVRVVIGLVRAGPIAFLMSQPVLVSFTSAAAVLIIATQVPGLVGLDTDARNPLLGALEVMAQPTAWRIDALVLGLAAFVVLLGGRAVSSFFPGALVAVVATTAYAALADYGGATVGEVSLDWALPRGIAPADVVGLLVPAAIIAVVGFAEPASIARKFAAQDRRRWDADREFVGQGLANLASGVAGGFPVGGSFSRTALNRLAGARTRWSGALTGVVVLLALPFVGLLEQLPVAALSGLVIAAVVNLVDVRAPRRYWGWSKPQFAVGTVTAVATLVLAPRVDLGVLVGVGSALAVHLWREARVQVPTEVQGDTLHIRPAGILYFVSAPMVEAVLDSAIADHPAVDHVVVHLDRVGRLDVSGVLTLQTLVERAYDGGCTVRFSGGALRHRALIGRMLGEDVLG
ncbi:STAS domain-containing protein [Nocardioidaceae bacterium]|nr:STAS domain-containing protein [Nocardioidaceae bacterium]